VTHTRTIELSTHQREALRCVARTDNMSVQEKISEALTIYLITRMENDPVLALHIAKALNVSWENLERLQEIDRSAVLAQQ
jgi:hypothetical protein